MNSFRQIVLGSLVALASVSAAYGQNNTATYGEVLRQCGAEWKASDQRKATAKGEGMAAWQAFRKDCVAKKGYKPIRQRNVADTTRAA
jgi:hypothetical protein